MFRKSQQEEGKPAKLALNMSDVPEGDNHQRTKRNAEGIEGTDVAADSKRVKTDGASKNSGPEGESSEALDEVKLSLKQENAHETDPNAYKVEELEEFADRAKQSLASETENIPGNGSGVRASGNVARPVQQPTPSTGFRISNPAGSPGAVITSAEQDGRFRYDAGGQRLAKPDFVKRLYTQPANINMTPNHGIQGLNTSLIDRQEGGGTKSQFHTNDPAKLNDALVAAGVDLQQEEELLMQQQMNRSNRYNLSQTGLYRQPQREDVGSLLLNPYHLAVYMQRVSKENGIQQNFFQDPELLELMSLSCEDWLSHIITKTIILSRHRRRGMFGNAAKNKKPPVNTQRSELSRELRNIALKQKELEEKRVAKRVALGIEKDPSDSSWNESGSGKADAEETLHRAANATAAMMANPGRKKYSWMNSGSNASNTDESSADKSGARQSTLISVRGDNGLRYREIRTGNTVTVKDLLSALEDERMGSEKALLKGYAKLRE